jgi:hypothetical protein
MNARFCFILTVSAAVFSLTIVTMLHVLGVTGTGIKSVDITLGCFLGYVSIVVGGLIAIKNT